MRWLLQNLAKFHKLWGSFTYPSAGVNWRAGTEVDRVMEERYGVVSELSTPMLVLYTFGYGSQSGDTRRLVVALERLVRRLARRAPDVKRKVAPRDTQTAAVGSLVAAVQLPEPVVEMLPRDAFFADAERCV